MDKKEELTQIVKTVQNDMEQFELLYSHIINKVYYWCYNVVNDETLAKDLAQECLIRIYQKLHTLDNAKAFHSWMYILVRNVCYNYVRLNKKVETQFLHSDSYAEGFENIIEEERVGNLPEEAYDLKETKQLIVSFVEELPRKQKEIIMLYYLEEFSTVEIANMLDCSVGTVKANLHYGRKNLEDQINSYQSKNSIKLYASVLIPLLGVLLQAHQDELCSKQDLSYDEKTFKTNSSKLSNAKNITHVNKLYIVGFTVVLSVILVAVILTQIIKDDDISFTQGTTHHQSLDSDEELMEKVKRNPYIESITYYTFPTRESTPVEIYLKKDISKNKIKILFDEEEVSFSKDDRKIMLSATKNGEYSIYINNNKLSFRINTIDAYAPEVVGIQNEGNYIQLVVNDELSRVNYEKSYIEFKGEKYQITNNKATGTFEGNVVVYIFNDLDQYMRYEFNLK